MKIENLKNFGEKVTRILVSIALLVVGFAVGVMHERCNKPTQPKVRALSTTSVSVNDRGEMMIMDRKDGSYVMYSDSVGMVVFDLYSNLIVDQPR